MKNSGYRFIVMVSFLSVLVFSAGTVVAQPLDAGDANKDYLFNQEDIIMALGAGKYLTGQSATWSEGDWNGAPGGSAASPPTGDNLFNQLDLIAALNAGNYSPGLPFYSTSPLVPGGIIGDSHVSVVYDSLTGEFGVDVPTSMTLTSFQLVSGAGIFTNNPATNLGGSFDDDSDTQIFKATFGSSFTSLSFGSIASPGLTESFLLSDLSVNGSLNEGVFLEKVDLNFQDQGTVPAPGAFILAGIGAGLVGYMRRRRTL